MKKRFLIGVLTLAASATHASVDVYTTRNSFEQTLGTKITDDYENPGYKPSSLTVLSDAAMSSVLGQTQYKATWFLNQNMISTANGLPNNHFYCSGCNGTFDLIFTHTSVGDSSGVYGVGFDLYSSVGTRAMVTLGDGSISSVDLPTQPYTTGAQSTFFGITSNQHIATISFVDAYPHTGGFVIDNLTIGSPIPEPSILSLSSLCLAAVFAAVKRSRPRCNQGNGTSTSEH